MPINEFNGNTFVAFCDISGFKELMKDDNKAVKALDHFYSNGYRILKENQLNNLTSIEGLFVSDSGVLFVNSQNRDQLRELILLLDTISQLNRNLLAQNLMLTTSIAFGPFSYHNRVEFHGIAKNPIFGNAYVSAFLDNETGKPKIQPGQCRIIRENLPDDIDENLIEDIEPRIKSTNKYHYYYWMIDDPDQIVDFEKQYKDAYQLKYSGMIKALKSQWA